AAWECVELALASGSVAAKTRAANPVRSKARRRCFRRSSKMEASFRAPKRSGMLYNAPSIGQAWRIIATVPFHRQALPGRCDVPGVSRLLRAHADGAGVSERSTHQSGLHLPAHAAEDHEGPSPYAHCRGV